MVISDFIDSLDEDEKDFANAMLEYLPKYVSRSKVSELTGYWLNSKTLKRDDCLGIGPRERLITKGGKQVLYSREALVEYGLRRFGIMKIEIYGGLGS